MKIDISDPLQPFKPMRLFQGPHAQTIAAHVFNCWKPKNRSKLLEVPLKDGDRLAILVDVPSTSPKAAVLLMHGLGGSASAKYMLSATRRLIENGYLVLRMNCRGAGEGAGIVRRMYHAGLSDDVRYALSTAIGQFPKLKFVLVGFSMSGNTVLKYAGEFGKDTPKHLAGIIAVNPTLDLERCIDAIEHPNNKRYHRRFTKLLIAQLVANSPRCRVPERVDLIDTIRAYDNAVTSQNWGFESAEAYYRQESAVMSIPNIAKPTIVLTSDDDPLIPVHIFSDVRWPDGTRLHVTQGGGHMGYLACQKTPLGDRRWLDYYLIYALDLIL